MPSLAKFDHAAERPPLLPSLPKPQPQSAFEVLWSLLDGWNQTAELLQGHMGKDLLDGSASLGLVGPKA